MTAPLERAWWMPGVVEEPTGRTSDPSRQEQPGRASFDRVVDLLIYREAV